MTTSGEIDMVFDDDLFPDRLSVFVKEYGTWSDTTFPDSSTESRMRHMCKEAKELTDEQDPAKAKLEIADLFLLLVHEAHVRGIDLIENGRIKFEINKKRTWGKTPEGTYEHDRQKD